MHIPEQVPNRTSAPSNLYGPDAQGKRAAAWPHRAEGKHGRGLEQLFALPWVPEGHVVPAPSSKGAGSPPDTEGQGWLVVFRAMTAAMPPPTHAQTTQKDGFL